MVPTALEPIGAKGRQVITLGIGGRGGNHFKLKFEVRKESEPMCKLSGSILPVVDVGCDQMRQRRASIFLSALVTVMVSQAFAMTPQEAVENGMARGEEIAKQSPGFAYG